MAFFDILGGLFWVPLEASSLLKGSDMNDIVRIHCLAEISGQKRPRYSIVIGLVMVDVKEIIFKHFWGVILGSP